MNCPACGKILSQLEHRGIVLDVCREGCAGIWFDNFELKKFDEPSETLSDELATLTPKQLIDPGDSKKRNCPKCSSVIMMRHLFSPQDKVAIDECPACAGIWLDAGELIAIRSRFSSEEERNQATQKFLSKNFDSQFSALHRESEEKAKSAQNIAHALRFLCPTYYVPGKQNWGGY